MPLDIGTAVHKVIAEQEQQDAHLEAGGWDTQELSASRCLLRSIRLVCYISLSGLRDPGEIAFLYDNRGFECLVVRNKASLMHATCSVSTCFVAASGEARCSSMATSVRASRPRSRRFSSLRGSSSAIAQRRPSSTRDIQRRRTSLISDRAVAWSLSAISAIAQTLCFVRARCRRLGRGELPTLQIPVPTGSARSHHPYSAEIRDPALRDGSALRARLGDYRSWLQNM